MSSPTPPGNSPDGQAGDNQPVSLTRETANRMARSTRYVERMQRARPPGGKNTSHDFRFTALARATSTISAASGLTYGTGTVTFLKDTGSALADDAPTGVTVKNLVSKTIASGSTNVLFLGFALNKWWVIAVRDCSMLS